MSRPEEVGASEGRGQAWSEESCPRLLLMVEMVTLGFLSSRVWVLKDQTDSQNREPERAPD